MTHPLARDIDIDSAEATSVHATLIRTKGFLRRQYEWYYEQFVAVERRAPAGLRLEIGSGGGFLGELIDNLLTVDVRPQADVTFKASACALPVNSQSVGGVFLLNVLHHLPEARHFFSELTRVLADGGRAVFIEPYVSPVSKWVYTHLHHEPFDPRVEQWSLPSQGPMSSANGALPWIIFVRDRKKFEAAFPELEIRRLVPHTALTYLLSGGVSMRSLLPGFAFGPLSGLEQAMGPRIRFAASMMTVEVCRRDRSRGA